MQQIVEATIDTFGRVRLEKTMRLDRKHKALVTILDEEPVSKTDPEWSPVGSMILVDEDLETASREISEEINRAIEKSAKEFAKYEN